MLFALIGMDVYLTLASPQDAGSDERIVALAGYPSTAIYDHPGDERSMFDAVNHLREQRGLNPLASDPALTRLARAHAADMIERGYLGHNTPEGTSPARRFEEAGVPFGYAGENIALNADEPSAEQALERSPHHRANLLEAHYDRIGIAALGDPHEGEIFVQEFSDGG